MGFTTLEEKENSPARNEKQIGPGKNRLKSALKFIEESFDINKKNELISQNNNIKYDINSNTGLSNTNLRERIVSKKDSTLKFMEENLIYNDKSPKDCSPQRYIGSNQNTNTYRKKVENTQDAGEYEFESRRKKK